MGRTRNEGDDDVHLSVVRYIHTTRYRMVNEDSEARGCLQDFPRNREAVKWKLLLGTEMFTIMRKHEFMRF